jgi:hypothetical protein
MQFGTLDAGNTMHRLLIILTLLAVVVGGCTHPTDIDLALEQGGNDLEITTLAPADSNLATAAVDSSAVLPSDQKRFAGLLLINDVKYDAGTGTPAHVALASAYFADLSRPLHLGQITFGYYGLSLGPTLAPLTINGAPMLRIPHRVKVLGTPVHWGYEYVRDITAAYSAGTQYVFRASPDSVGAIEASIDSPEDVNVLAPLGKSIIPRTNDLVMRWTGRGDITIVVSTYNPLINKTRPVLTLHPRVNRGHATLTSRVLRALPKDRYYVFTFVIANRRESLTVNGYAGTILLQAASVYNSYVELR